jgi:glucose-1-phosphate cytidylyltransferase
VAAKKRANSLPTKTVILAGGLGTRIGEESQHKPKPMIEIGQKPLLWHIMKIYSHFGVNDFIICLGYKGYVVKEYFANYYLHSSDVTFDLQNNAMQVHHSATEPWRVTLVDTGPDTMTGGRLKRIRQYVANEAAFFMTYGDGVADVDIARLAAFHRREGRLATVTAVQPPGRFGALVLEGGRVSQFEEKPLGDGGWINGGFFVLHPEALDYVEGDAIAWEREPLARLSADQELSGFRHEGFWQPVDTLRDLSALQALWDSGQPPWKVWA